MEFINISKQCRKLRKKTHIVISAIVGGLYRLLCVMKIAHSRVIVYVDGGICSQMNQFLIGVYYQEMGLNVGYDLSWYAKDGWDVDKKYRREFELDKLYPSIRIKTFSKFTNWFYRFFLMHVNDEHLLPTISKHQPMYVGGYYNIPNETYKFLFHKTYDALPTANIHLSYLNKDEGKTCAVHVRRGDLAKGDNPYYGGVSDTYFFEAIQWVRTNEQKVKFVFFSDEMFYVKDSILPYLSNIEYECSASSNKAYEDLLSMSKCDIIIGSQGSFGKIAAMMNRESLLILPNNTHANSWIQKVEHIKLI